METNKKIEFEISKLVLATYNRIAIWNNSDFDSATLKSDALKVVSQEIVQNALEQLMEGLNLKTGTHVTRGDVSIGDTTVVKDEDSFSKSEDKDVLDKLFEKKS